VDDGEFLDSAGTSSFQNCNLGFDFDSETGTPDVQAMHRVRDRLVQRRTALINEIRGLLLERGLTFAAQPTHLRKNLPEVIEDAEQNLSSRLRWLLERFKSCSLTAPPWPIDRIESGGTKEISGRSRIAPFAVLKSGHIEMHEHAESQIHKPLLQIQEWQSATRTWPLRTLLLRCGVVSRGQHRCGRSSSGQLDELSP
jgi:hypothetical protein